MVKHTELQTFLSRVRETTRRGLSPSATLRHVMDAMDDMLESPPVLQERHRQLPPIEEGGYGRNLIYRDLETEFVAVAMVWPAGFMGTAHDHGTWGIVGVLEGTVRLITYGREDDASDPTRIELRELASIEAGPGAMATVLPPHEDFHAVGNASKDRLAITLHVYGHDVPLCRSVDTETGEVKTMQSSYTSEEQLGI